MKLKSWTEEQFKEKYREALAIPKDISITRLIDDGLVILYREIKSLNLLSESGKLDAANSKDLRDHLKLLFDLQLREKESLRNMSDAELESQAKQVLDDK